MIELPSDCALVAVKACYELGHSNIRCRALAVTYQLKPKHRHIVVVFEFEGRLRVYDRDGSVSLSKSLSLSDTPDRIAKSWAKMPDSLFPPLKALKGEWY